MIQCRSQKGFCFHLCAYQCYGVKYSVGDEVETIINGVRNEVKSAGQHDTRENCWSFFIDRVRRQLKVSYPKITIT